MGGGRFDDISSFFHRYIKKAVVPLVLCMALLCTALFTSCEKVIADDEGYPVMQQYYVESLKFSYPEVDEDSVSRYSLKVGNYVYQHPDAKKTSFYDKIQTNIRAYLALLNIDITFENDGEWGDTIYISFDFQ